MKSRTSSCNKTIFFKDVTRFAPLWGLYIVASLLVYMTVNSGPFFLASAVGDSMPAMAWCSFFYAFFCAQAVFGDLFSSRMCNSLHAMPMRRERWFATHALSGISFAFVPHLIFAGICLPGMGGHWEVALGWMIGTDLQFLFFFGMAVLAVMCAGNRIAAALVYLLTNFISLIVAWFLNALYIPMLCGIEMDTTPFEWLCPVAQMSKDYRYFNLTRIRDNGEWTGAFTVELGWESWAYVAACAAVGAGLLVLALWLYKRRKLEVAGDFMAVRALEPVFLVLYSLSAAALLHLMSNLFSDDVAYLFLFVGLAIGYFTGQMFLSRSVRVFGLKKIGGFALLAAALALSLVLTAVDVLGITRWVPQAEEVRTVTLQEEYNHGSTIVLDEPEEIADILAIHAQAIVDQEPTNRGTVITTYSTEEGKWKALTRFRLTYRLKSGATVTRHYALDIRSPGGELIRSYLTSAECILGYDLPNAQAYNQTLSKIEVDGVGVLTENQRISFLEAVLADCEAGTMAQASCFHVDHSTVCYALLAFTQDRRIEDAYYSEYTINIFSNCENTMAWYMENADPEYWKWYAEKDTYQDDIPHATTPAKVG